MEKEPEPSTPNEAKASKAEGKEDPRLPSKDDPSRLPSFIPRTGLVFSERTAFAPVLCPPKLLPIRPYHVQRGQARGLGPRDIEARAASVANGRALAEAASKPIERRGTRAGSFSGSVAFIHPPDARPLGPGQRICTHIPLGTSAK